MDKEINNLKDIRRHAQISHYLIILFLILTSLWLGINEVGFGVLFASMTIISAIERRYWDNKYHMIKIYKKLKEK